MVCVPCFIIPVLLWIWHRFFQPILLRYWNPWEKKDAQGNVIKEKPEFPFDCKGGTCVFAGSKNKSLPAAEQSQAAENVKLEEMVPLLSADNEGSKKEQ